MKPKLFTFVGILVMMAILYVLSIGPMFGFYVKPTVGEPDAAAVARWERFEKIYAPLFWLCETSPPVKSALGWYGHLWTD